MDGRRLVLTKDPKRKRYRRSTWTWKATARKAEAWALDGKDIIGVADFVMTDDAEVKIQIRKSGTVGAIIIKYDEVADTQIFPVSWPVNAGDIVHFRVS